MVNVVFFFLLILPPPISTLFPYTTLFRSRRHGRLCRWNHRPEGKSPIQRSEEHTSELQSLRHLVCRLLLEKKKSLITVSSSVSRRSSVPSRSRRTIAS